MKFTDMVVKKLKPKESRFEVLETNRPGFGLRITPKGTKTFIFVYQFKGKNRRMSLGKYPAMKLTEAHQKHADARQLLGQGIDPGEKEQAEKEKIRSAPTVIYLVNEYIERWAKPRKKTWKEDQRMLNLDVVSRWGDMKAMDVTKKHILRMLDELLERGATTTANRTFAVTRKLFNWAVERGELDFSPCTGVRAPAKETPRERILSEEEIKSFWDGLENANMTDSMKLVFKLQLLTAQRKGEVVGTPWTEIDFDKKEWLIPAERTKNGVATLIPLSESAIDHLGAIKVESKGSEWLFPSGRTQTHIIETSADHAIRNNLQHFNCEQFTPHDLRRTAASHMTALGVSRLVVSKILNHVDRSVTAIYDRHSYDKEKREALDAWAKKLNEIVAGKQ
ncbi:MAG: tyrosine-type recombinase/integrase [Magnetococcales bacterium]|nr:tyrosine-type recombinase/integrase [Magnetococcales bacterium]